MSKFVPNEDFSMAAVIGLESAKIEEICREIREEGKFVVPANYNYSNQTVISGNTTAIEIAMEKLKEEGAKRVLKLNTSGPFHTEKLELAKNNYEKELEKLEFKKGNINVIKNIDGKIYTKKDNIKEILAKHIVSPVRFDKTIKLMQELNIEQYVEIGPGKTLTGFVKKEIKDANVINLNDLSSLNEFIKGVEV